MQPFVLAPYTGAPRRTCLYDQHLALISERNLAPFAGWLLPIRFGSIVDEYRAVRHSAALFDVTHMGIIAVEGDDAGNFLEAVTTGHILSLPVGRAVYTFLLLPDGTPIDDVLVFHRDERRFLVVANAANAEVVEQWFNAVNSREVSLYSPEFERSARRVRISNLKEDQAGDDQRVDIALQGPRSLEALERVLSSQSLEAIALLKHNDFVEVDVMGYRSLISHTGYTGEPIGFELLVHPTIAPSVWTSLLANAADLGVVPAGLAARDMARIEAGFPLFGHELAGEFQISPIGAGYGRFVKTDKPFFVGKAALLAAEESRTREVVRLGTPGRGLRAIRAGDPVLSRRGRCIGHVTSSSMIEVRQIALAYVERQHATQDTDVFIWPVSQMDRHALAESRLPVGSEVPQFEVASVLPRFGIKQAKQT